MQRLLFIAFIFSCFIIGACSTSEHFGSLSVTGDSGRKSPVTYRKVTATVSITGEVAETTLEITFANKTKQDLEAHLNLPLPQGATISRYALEVDGKMREGVIVEKQKGRIAFEDTIRKNIDPGLLEKTTGNSFRTRIYPVPAKGTKRVLLSYLEPLRSSDGRSYRYNLPIPLNEQIGEFSLKISASAISFLD
jgi:hypothetical protein